MRTDMKLYHNCLICNKELPEIDIACVFINKFERGRAILVCPDCNGGKMAITVSLSGAPRDQRDQLEKPCKIDWSLLSKTPPLLPPEKILQPEHCHTDPNYTEVLDDDANISIPR